MAPLPMADANATEQRTDPPNAGDERSTLTGFLNFQRQTLMLKCAGLTPAQLVARSVPTSDLSLLGLVRHLTQQEHGWLEWLLAGRAEQQFYGPDGDADFAITEADDATVAAAFAQYAEQVGRGNAALAGFELDALMALPHPISGQRYSVRWILAHLIEEYARHNGHADLIRQAIDGAVGE